MVGSISVTIVSCTRVSKSHQRNLFRGNRILEVCARNLQLYEFEWSKEHKKRYTHCVRVVVYLIPPSSPSSFKQQKCSVINSNASLLTSYVPIQPHSPAHNLRCRCHAAWASFESQLAVVHGATVTASAMTLYNISGIRKEHHTRNQRRHARVSE